MDSVVIRPLRDNDSVPELTALLRAAYAPLAAMGLRYTATWQDDSITLRRLTTGLSWVGELDGRLVATATLYPDDGHSATACPWYRRPGVFHFGQFAVHPKLQRHGTGTRLVRHLEREALARGATELALDTAETAVHLIRWYETLGFRTVGFLQGSSTNYRSVVMSKMLPVTSP